MAAKKRKRAGAAKRKAAPSRKSTSKARKTTKRPAKKSAKTARKSVKAAAKKTPVRKAPARKAPARKSKTKTKGEGDYAASRAFLKDQAGFVEKNKGRIPAMGKEAEKALDGPDGAGLRDAEAAAAARSRDTF